MNEFLRPAFVILISLSILSFMPSSFISVVLIFPGIPLLLCTALHTKTRMPHGESLLVEGMHCNKPLVVSSESSLDYYTFSFQASVWYCCFRLSGLKHEEHKNRKTSLF